MATLDQLLREYRRQLVALDRATAQQLIAAHRAHLASLQAALTNARAAIIAAGTIDDAMRWMRESQAARTLLAAAEAGMAEFGAYAAQQIEARQAELVELALKHDERLTYAAIVGESTITPATAGAIRAAFTAIPVEAVSSMVGVLQPASPVRQLFDEFGVKASRRLGETMVDGITRGQGAAQIGRRLRADLDGDAARALTIARTETHRAYRDSSLDRYRANPRVYAGWRWNAHLDSATCPVCVSKHGSEHGLDEDFGGHPNCRCRPVPIPNDLTEILGDTSDEAMELQARIEAAKPSVQGGAEWFAGLDEAAQQRILGVSKTKAYRAGEISLDDVVVDRVDPVWGRTHRTASLETARANAARR